MLSEGKAYSFWECGSGCEGLGGTMPCLDSPLWHKDLNSMVQGKAYWSGVYQRPGENTNYDGWDNWHADGCTNRTYFHHGLITYFDDWDDGSCRSQEACGFLNYDGDTTTMHDAACGNEASLFCICEFSSTHSNTASANYTRDVAKLKAESGSRDFEFDGMHCDEGGDFNILHHLVRLRFT